LLSHPPSQPKSTRKPAARPQAQSRR
jgi:hypothetical protein